MTVTLYRKRGFWYVNYSIGSKRIQQSTRTRNRQIAEAIRSETELRLFRGEIANSIQSDEAQITVVFLRFLRSIEKSYADYKTEATRLRNWQEYLLRKGLTTIDQISPAHVDDFFTTALGDHSPKTKRNYLGILKTCLNRAVQWGLIRSNPIASVRPPKLVKAFHYFSPEEMEAIKAVAGEPLRTAIVILVNTGLRRSELYNLRWRDVSIQNRQLTVMPYGDYKTKSRRLRTVPLNRSACEALNRAREFSGDSEFVFRHYSKHWMGEKFSKILKSIGIKGSLKSLRHTFATRLSEKGVPIPVIKEFLGHSTIETTMIYAHLAPHLHREAVNEIDEG